MKMWIARDLNGSLALYEREPKLVVDQVWTGGCSIWISPKEYPEVTFENSLKECIKYKPNNYVTAINTAIYISF